MNPLYIVLSFALMLSGQTYADASDADDLKEIKVKERVFVTDTDLPKRDSVPGKTTTKEMQHAKVDEANPAEEKSEEVLEAEDQPGAFKKGYLKIKEATKNMVHGIFGDDDEAPAKAEEKKEEVVAAKTE